MTNWKQTTSKRSMYSATEFEIRISYKGLNELSMYVANFEYISARGYVDYKIHNPLDVLNPYTDVMPNMIPLDLMTEAVTEINKLITDFYSF